LRSGNVISAAVESRVRKVISRLEERWQIKLNEENGGRIVTHLSMALMRIEKGEHIASPEDSIIEEFRNLEVFEKSCKITDDIAEWAELDLPEAEKEYMIVNICLLLDE